MFYPHLVELKQWKLHFGSGLRFPFYPHLVELRLNNNRGKTMILHYEGDAFGFTLFGGDDEYENEWSEQLESIGCYSIVYLNQKGEVVYLDVEAPFGPDCILEMAEWVKQNPPPGIYTVPELGIKDAPFFEVLLACYNRVGKEFKKDFISR